VNFVPGSVSSMYRTCARLRRSFVSNSCAGLVAKDRHVSFFCFACAEHQPVVSRTLRRPWSWTSSPTSLGSRSCTTSWVWGWTHQSAMHGLPLRPPFFVIRFNKRKKATQKSCAFRQHQKTTVFQYSCALSPLPSCSPPSCS